MSIIGGYLVCILIGVVIGFVIHEKIFPEHKTVNEIAKIKNSNVTAMLGTDDLVCPFHGNCGCTAYCTHFPGRRLAVPSKPKDGQPLESLKKKGLLRRIFHGKGKI